MFRRASKAFIPLFALVASHWLCAQKTDDAKPCEQSMVFVHDLYKQGGGWEIAFIDTSKVLSKEVPVKTSDPTYSGVTSVQLGLKGNEFYFPKIRLDKCSGKATIEELKMFVYRVFAFKKGDRTFAYELSGGFANLVNGEWQACACAGEVLVYDPDGTGTFSHLIPYSSLMPYVPEWARGDVSPKSK